MNMDDEADAAREYDRLRAELADFVLDALAERVAQGQQPQLSQALVEAIDRRVEEAVAARVARSEWPDPDSFADSVIAAAAGRAGTSGDRMESSSSKARRPSEDERGARAQPGRSRRLTSGQIGLLTLLGIAIIGVAAFLMWRAWNSPTTNTVVMNVQGNSIEPTPDGAANAQLPPAGGTAAPTSAGAPENVQGQPR
jgi:hypothetical protein